MATEDKKLNALFLPYFILPSHMTPLVDTARLFAARGVTVTILITQSNALMFQPSIDRAAAAGHRIAFHTIKFPAAEVGLPEGIESLRSVTSPEMNPKLAAAMPLLQKPMEQSIRDLRPDCIVSDFLYPWTVDIAEELGIPRLILSVTSCFYDCVFHSLKIHKPYEKLRSDSESFVIPGLPNEIEMTGSQLENYLKNEKESGDDGKFLNQIIDSETRSYGVVYTSCSEIEPDYAQHYKNILRKRCWHVGIPSLILEKDNKSNAEQQHHSCLNWLDNQKPNSVLYICFGSMTRFLNTQLTEIAFALDESEQPFVWVVKKIGETDETGEETWLPEGFEERVEKSKKGMIIKDRAPQVSILAHPAIGGFVTHCGWNSVSEGVAAGVPFITWPLFAEQFYNEKLITRVLKIGVEVGSGVWNRGSKIRSPVVGKDKIVKAVSCLMGGSEEAQEIRRRAKEVSAMVKRSVEEGGSSSSNLNSLIEEIKAYVFRS